MKPVQHVTIYKVKKRDKEGYKKRASWLLNDMKTVDGKDAYTVGTKYEHVIMSSSIRKCKKSRFYYKSRTLLVLLTVLYVTVHIYCWITLSSTETA